MSPGAASVGNFKAVFNLRGDPVDTNLGWRGAEKYVATVPQEFDLSADPQESYDLFMNNFTERTLDDRARSQAAIKTLTTTYVQYPPRKLQSIEYNGPIEISKYQKFQWVREQLAKDGINLLIADRGTSDDTASAVFPGAFSVWG